MATNEAELREASIIAEIRREKKKYSMLKSLEAFSKKKYEEPHKDLELLEYKEQYQSLLLENNLSDSSSIYLFFKDKADESDARITDLCCKLTCFVTEQILVQNQKEVRK